MKPDTHGAGSVHVVLNATAYDGLPSGARARAVCLAAAWLDLGVRVTVFAPRGVSLRAAVQSERWSSGSGAELTEIATPFHSARPLQRALRSERWLRARMPRDTDLFVTDFYPVLDDVPTALTVHDLRYLVAPQFESGWRAAWFRHAYPRRARRAPWIVVPTRAVAAEAESVLGVGAARVVVAPNALRRGWRRAAVRAAGAATAKPADGYALAVGVGDRRKNLDVLVDAARRLAAEGRPARSLVLVGRRCRRIERLLETVPELEAQGRVRHAGLVTDRRLREILQGAHVLVHPSRYEGFGLTVIEALALGVPVAAGRCAAVEEVADGQAHLVDPNDVAAWADVLAQDSVLGAMEASASHSDQFATWTAQRERGRRHALTFDWLDSACAILRAAGHEIDANDVTEAHSLREHAAVTRRSPERGLSSGVYPPEPNASFRP